MGMPVNMDTMTEFEQTVSDSAKTYLIKGGKLMLSSDRKTLFIVGHKDLDFKIEDIAKIDNDLSFNNKLQELINRQEVPVSPTMEKEDPIAKTQVDMLVTQVMDPVKIEEPKEETTPDESVVTPIAEPVENKTPELMPAAKTLGLVPSENKKAGFADVLILSIIVIIYIAIIVNLIIRLK